MKDDYLAVALQLVTQFVDICIVDCRKELQFECDSSLAVGTEIIAVAGVALFCRTNLSGRGIGSIGGLDARIAGGDECDVDKILYSAADTTWARWPCSLPLQREWICRALPLFNSRWRRRSDAWLGSRPCDGGEDGSGEDDVGLRRHGGSFSFLFFL